MRLVSGSPFWVSVNPIPYSYSYLTEDITCEVLIIGAGIAGALTAHYFAEAGIDTVVVDKHIIGYGSTSASTAILQHETDSNLVKLPEKIGKKNAIRCFELCSHAVDEIDKLTAPFPDKCGFRRPEFAGAYLDPYRLTHSLLQLAWEKGVHIYENTNIDKIASDNKSAVATTSTYRTIKARKVIVTAGYAAVKCIGEGIAKLSRSYTIVTEPAKNFTSRADKCLIRDPNSNYHLRTTPDGRFIIGGEAIALGCLPDIDWVLDSKADILRKRLVAMFPQCEGSKVTHKFSGLLADTKDGLPYIGEYQPMPNCYFLLGFGTSGILYATFGAQMLRDLYRGQRAPELELFRFSR